MVIISQEGLSPKFLADRSDHEYVVVIFKDERFLNKIKETPDFRYEYGNPDNDPRGPYKAGSISRREDASDSNHPNYYTVTSPSRKKFTRQFDVPEDEFKKLDNDILINKFGKKVSRIYWGKKGDAVPAIKIFLNEQREITPYSVLMKGTTTEGTKHLENILGGDFKSLRPKPVPLIKTLVQLASTDDSIVLDFFAGSGTTGEAVLELNKELGGERSYILCTNDESGICTGVCYPRVKKVIRGYTGKKDKKKYPEMEGNLKYYKTDFVDSEPTDKNKKKLTEEATEMLCIKEGTFEEILDKKDFKIFKNNSHYTGIIFDQLAIPEFKKTVKDIKGKFSVYVFSLSDETFDEEFSDVKQKIKLSPIPEAILRVYRRIFK
jgi:adenine-specific DNA-methyltransferase